MSGSDDRIKIKNVATVKEIKERVDEIVKSWANKYKMDIKKINETTYYIMGKIK